MQAIHTSNLPPGEARHLTRHPGKHKQCADPAWSPTRSTNLGARLPMSLQGQNMASPQSQSLRPILQLTLNRNRKLTENLPKTMQARCQCGLITFTTPTPLPSALYICHCNECRRQSSSLFGTTAIFPAFTVQAPPHFPGAAISVYTRTTLSGRRLDCYFARAAAVG